MLNIWKKHATVGSLSATLERERKLIAGVELALDAGERAGGLIEEIAAECQRMVLAEPDVASWRFLLGRFLMASGHPDEARDALEQAALIDPRDVRIAAHLGLWYEAAFLAARLECSNVELPRLAGPEVNARIASFRSLDEDLPLTSLASRAEELLRASLAFSLKGSDVRFLKRHIAIVTTTPTAPVEPLPANVVVMARAG